MPGFVGDAIMRRRKTNSDAIAPRCPRVRHGVCDLRNIYIPHIYRALWTLRDIFTEQYLHSVQYAPHVVLYGILMRRTIIFPEKKPVMHRVLFRRTNVWHAHRLSWKPGMRTCPPGLKRPMRQRRCRTSATSRFYLSLISP